MIGTSRMNNEKYTVKIYRTKMNYLSILIVLYSDNKKPWVLLPWNNTINGLYHYQVIGDTLILCHEKKGLYKYCLITQTLLSHLVYPKGFKVSGLDDKNYNETADKLLLQGSVRYIDDEGEEEDEDLILIIDTATLQIEKQAHDLEKRYWSVAVQHREKPYLWSMVSGSFYDKYDFQEDLLTYNSKEERYIRQPFKTQQGSTTHSADTWISPSGKLVIRTKYEGLNVVSKNGKRHIQHKVELFSVEDTFDTKEIVVYNREEEFVGYLYEMPEELEKQGRGDYEEGESPFEEWQELWRKISYSKQAYAVYNFARYTPWIHNSLCYLWNKTHLSIVEEDAYNTPIEEVIEESDDIHNDLYVVTWEKDEQAFWVLFRGGFLRRVSLDGTLSSLFKIGGNSRNKLQTPKDHYGKLNINNKGVIEVTEGLHEKFSDIDFSFDPNSYDMSDENKLILLKEEDDITKKDVISKCDEEYIENSVLNLLALTLELEGELTTEYVREKIAELRDKIKDNLDDYIHQYNLIIVFIDGQKRYSEDYFFKNHVNDTSLLSALKELLDSYLNALSTAKRRALYMDEETPSLESALDAYIRLSNRATDKYIPQALYEQISKWMRYYYYYLEIPIFERYVIDENWLRLSFISEMTAPYDNMWIGRWKEKDNLYIYEKFSNETIAEIFFETFESLWEEVLLRKIKADPYSEFADNEFSEEEMLSLEKRVKKETYKYYSSSDYFSDELQTEVYKFREK